MPGSRKSRNKIEQRGVSLLEPRGKAVLRIPTVKHQD